MPSLKLVHRRTAPLIAMLLLLTGCAPERTVESAPSTSGTEAMPEDAAETEAPVAPEPSEPENPGLDQGELDSRLRAAAWSNDVAAAEQLISWGADVNAKDGTEQSAYLIATSEGRLELLDLTLAHGADVGALDSWNGTGLIRAAERGHWEVSGELIQAGVDIHHVNRVGYQAIHEAVIFGRDDPTYHAAVRVLVAGGASLSTPSESEGLTPLQMAQNLGYSEQITNLEELARGNPGDPESALLESAASGDANAVARALRAGAPVDARDSEDRTALEIAEDAGNIGAASVIRALGG